MTEAAEARRETSSVRGATDRIDPWATFDFL